MKNSKFNHQKNPFLKSIKITIFSFALIAANLAQAQSLPPNAKLFDELPSFKFYLLDRSSNQRGDYVRNNNDGTFTGSIWIVGIGRQKGSLGRLIVDANCSKKLVRILDADSGKKGELDTSKNRRYNEFHIIRWRLSKLIQH